MKALPINLYDISIISLDIFGSLINLNLNQWSAFHPVTLHHNWLINCLLSTNMRWVCSMWHWTLTWPLHSVMWLLVLFDCHSSPIIQLLRLRLHLHCLVGSVVKIKQKEEKEDIELIIIVGVWFRPNILWMCICN